MLLDWIRKPNEKMLLVAGAGTGAGARCADKCMANLAPRGCLWRDKLTKKDLVDQTETDSRVFV